MAPVFAAKLFPHFDAPVDFGRSFCGKRIFGDHKTYRGLLAGVIAGALTFEIQVSLARNVESLSDLSITDESALGVALWGALLGLGALTGDLLKSFVKRQFRIAPGKPWFPWDQIDWIVGTLAVLRLLTPIPFTIAIFALVLGLLMHLIIKWVGYFLRLNESRI